MKNLVVVFFTLCGLATVTAYAAPQAAISLTGSNATVVQASNTAWSLANQGSLANGSASWSIKATEGTIGPPLIMMGGFMTVSNTGTASATIGNIVVNLQKKSGNNWITVSSDTADAYLGNRATSANICSGASSEVKYSFSTNAASQPIQFYDANNNSI